MSESQLCGTAAGYNILGAAHTMTCEACKAASRNWATGYFKAIRNGTREQWVKANPPKSVTA